MRSFQTIPDSDQSISDEEESDQDWPNTGATLAGFAQTKEELPLLLRLEMLKGGNVYANKLEDEVSSDDEGNNVLVNRSDAVGAKELRRNDVCKEEGSNTWFAASKEAEALFRLNEKASCSSVQSSHLRVNKSSKGVKGKGKPKFTFHFQTNKEGQSCSSVFKDENDVPFKFQEMPERLDAIDPRTTEHMDAELLEEIQGEGETQLEIVPIEVNDVGHGTTQQSMADLLDGLHYKITTPRYSRKRHKRAHAVMKRVSPLGDRLMESESSPEHVGLGSTSGSDENDQTLKLDKLEVKRQTLVDLFQDALTDRALIPMPKPLRIGLFGQLQQVLLSEKQTDMEFLKNIEQGDDQNDTSCIDVKIVSKCLDAKLTVCCCLFGNLKSLPWPESPKNTVNDETTGTVIFNPRVCDDVDLDVGKWIRIHPPWKEIRECNDKGIILSTYFSEILI